VIVASRLRKGSANSARGAARLVADALCTSRACGAAGLVIVRADSAFDGRDVIAAIGRAGARFSITARLDPAVRRAIAATPDTALIKIRYPHAVFNEQLGQWVSHAEVAEVPFTAFTAKPRAQQVPARLILRRVRDANPAHVMPMSRVSGSRPGGTMPFSPTRRCPCSTPKPTTAATPSSNRSSPTLRTARWRTCLPAGSTPTARGWSWPPWPSTSAAPPHPCLPLPREGDHRDDPRPAEQRASPNGPLRAADAITATSELALAGRLARPVHRHRRTTRPTRCLTNRPSGPDRRSRGNAGHTGECRALEPSPPPKITNAEPNQASVHPVLVDAVLEVDPSVDASKSHRLDVVQPD
jgi:hypothetical protein